jgi:hypothetical protein
MAKAAGQPSKGIRKASRSVVRGLTTAALTEATGRMVRKAASSPSALREADLPSENVEDTVMNNEQGPSLAQLRRKFFGSGVTDSKAGDAPVLGPMDKDVQTVQVQRKQGGAIKTADIKNGKVQIVQG